MPIPSSASNSPWATLLPAALAGTGRQPFAPQPGLTPNLGAEAGAAEKQLLLTAANLALVQRASSSSDLGLAQPLPPLPPETRPEPEFVRALLAVSPRPADPELHAGMQHHLPLAERIAWAKAQLPTDPAAPAEPEWTQLFSNWSVPLAEPALLRSLLPLLAAAFAHPRTSTNARQCSGLPGLLDRLHSCGLNAELYPEVQAALGAVVPVRPAAHSLKHLLQGLAARYDLLQACRASASSYAPA